MAWKHPFLFGPFAKYEKATVTFVTSVRPSVCQHGTAWLALDGFWWKFFFRLFRKPVEKITDTLHEDVFTFMTISCWFLLRMRNVSNKICRENQNAYFMFNNVLRKSCLSWECRKIWSQRGQKWRHNMAHTLCMLDKQGYMHACIRLRARAHARKSARTHKYIIFIVFHSNNYSRKRLSVTLHVRTLYVLLLLKFSSFKVSYEKGEVW